MSFAYATAALFLALSVLLTQFAQPQKAISRADRTYVREAAVREVGQAVSSYLDRHGTLPPTLDAVAAEPGFGFVKSFLQMPSVGYAVSGFLNDGSWQYQRAVVFAQNPASAVPTATFLGASKNLCGTGDFNTADSWCGDRGSKSYRLETRERYPSLIAAQRLRMHATIRKLAVHYNDSGMFDAVPGNVATLASLAGYTGTALNCNGIYRWGNVPLDCGDLFSLFGTPVTVNRHTDQAVTLIARTPIVNGNGEAIAVASNISLDLF
jgi:hypothetical protein